VHPQKTEVRFADPRAAADAVYSIASRELASALSLPPGPRNRFAPRAAVAHVAPDFPIWGKRKPDEPRTPLSSAAVGEGEPPDTEPSQELPRTVVAAGTERAHIESQSHWGATAQTVDTEQARVGAPLSPNKDRYEPASASSGTASPLRDGGLLPASSENVRWSSLRFVAQLRQTFLLCEGPAGIYVLDQHAAAERVAFQRLLDQYRAQTMAAQTLLFPASVELTQEEVELVEQRAAEIAAVGLDVRVRGRTQVTVHAIPRLLQRASPERLLCDLVGEMARSGGRGFSAAIEHALSLMACHGSLRAGDAISPSEAQALLGALDTVDFAGHCAHGRPVVAVVSYNELERKVGRR